MVRLFGPSHFLRYARCWHLALRNAGIRSAAAAMVRLFGPEALVVVAVLTVLIAKLSQTAAGKRVKVTVQGWCRHGIGNTYSAHPGGRDQNSQKTPWGFVLLVGIFVAANSGLISFFRQRVGFFQEFGTLTLQFNETSFQCTRLELLPGSLGTNIIDLPDDSDGDHANDGMRGYGSSKGRLALDYFKELGASFIVLPINFHLDSCSATKVLDGATMRTRLGRYRLARMIQDAHERDLRVALVPHLFVGEAGVKKVADPQCWHGAIKPQARGKSDVEALEMFFLSYQDAVKRLAKIAEQNCVEVLAAGRELKSLTVSDEDPEKKLAMWKTFVAEVKTIFTGQVTYSSNWDETHEVVQGAQFWQLFDFVSVNAFFPLADTPLAKGTSLAEKQKSQEEMVQRALFTFKDRINALKECTGMPIWFMEHGFRAMANCAMHPWMWPGEVLSLPAVPEDQRKFWEVSSLEQSPVVDGEAQSQAYNISLSAIENMSLPPMDAVSLWAVPVDIYDDTRPNLRSTFGIGATYRQNHPLFEPSYGFNFVDKPAADRIKSFAARYAQNMRNTVVLGSASKSIGHSLQKFRRRVSAESALSTNLGTCLIESLQCRWGEWTNFPECTADEKCDGWAWITRERACTCGTAKQVIPSLDWDSWVCASLEGDNVEGKSCEYDVSKAAICSGKP
mmetsp:Transcript_13192/g.48087  ORF Transcript_13192/g.48087 Transcript_13192/m.48087 type:complete len:676 (-) Transcript_13192:129-2156(-)